MFGRIFGIFALLATLLSAGTASATVIPSKGGPGGGFFAAPCSPGQYVVGFAAQAGAWVDGVAPLCAPYLPSPGTFAKGQSAGFHGAHGGSPQTQLCSPGKAVTRLLLGVLFEKGGVLGDDTKKTYIDYIGFECADIHGQAKENRCVATGDPCAELDSIVACPSGELATGINGRSGAFVDALGLICGPAPRTVVLGKAKPQSGGQTPAPNILKGNGVLKGNGRVVTLPGQPPATQPPAPPPQPQSPAQPPSYALTCLGGGHMRANATSDGFVRITFGPASQGSSVAPPRKGECAWGDRGFRPGEPQMLVYSGARAGDLAKAAKKGKVFQVHAYNNNQGAMVVTSIDAIGGKF